MAFSGGRWFGAVFLSDKIFIELFNLSIELKLCMYDKITNGFGKF